MGSNLFSAFDMVCGGIPLSRFIEAMIPKVEQIQRSHEETKRESRIDVRIPNGDLSNEQVEQVCDDGIDVLAKINNFIRKSKNDADEAKTLADDAKKIKAGIIFNKECIMQLQDFAVASAKAQTIIVDAMTLCFENQKRMVDCCDKIHDMAMRNGQMLKKTIEYFKKKIKDLKEVQSTQNNEATEEKSYLIENLERMLNGLTEQEKMVDSIEFLKGEIEQLKVALVKKQLVK